MDTICFGGVRVEIFIEFRWRHFGTVHTTHLDIAGVVLLQLCCYTDAFVREGTLVSICLITCLVLAGVAVAAIYMRL